jgi:hypothetical protein
VVCCAGGSVWSGVVCCADEGEAKNPNAKAAQTNVARCMGGSDGFTVTIAGAVGSGTGPSAIFSGAEARPVSCACAGVWGILLVEIASLLIKLFRHRSEDQAGALVVLAVGEIATMLGMEPKLLCGAAHEYSTNIG